VRYLCLLELKKQMYMALANKLTVGSVQKAATLKLSRFEESGEPCITSGQAIIQFL
jgi:hypothetical protein